MRIISKPRTSILRPEVLFFDNCIVSDLVGKKLHTSRSIGEVRTQVSIDCIYSFFMVKLLRAYGGCLGRERR